MKLGRNQKIASVAYGTTFATAIAVIALLDPEKAELFLDWSVVFVPVAIGSLTALSAAVKLKNGNGK